MHRALPRVRRLASTAALWLLFTSPAWLPGVARAYCDEPADQRAPRMGLPDPGGVGTSELFELGEQGDALRQLGSLAREAIGRSAEVKATLHIETASRYDLDQVEAGRRPLVTVGGTAGVGQTRASGTSSGVGGVGDVRLGVSAPLFDGGRIDRMVDYRRGLLEASKHGVGAQREFIVDEAVLAALDRNRFRLQARVYQQYVAKMSCLVRSLEQIVASDRGRASELAQARQSQRQAEIARDSSLSALRQADIHLRKLVGDNVEPWSSIGAPLLQLPALPEVVAQIESSPTVRALKLQADAAESLASATAAQRSPQVNWQVGTGASRAANVNGGTWNAGVSFSYVIDDGGALKAATGAAQERAQAVRRQVDATVNERVRQAGSLHEAARAAFARAQQYAAVLRDSDQVRNATFEQWSRLGRRSLFDLMSAESSHYQQRIAYIDALHDGFATSAQLRASGSGLLPWIAPELSLPVGR